jgi:mediator of RNA polymerase II transcription subunit 16, fungi type
MIFRPLRHGMIHSTNGLKTALQYDQKMSFNKLLQIYQGTPITIPPLENYLMDVDTLVKSVYRSAGVTDTAREEIEREMFITARIPEILMPAVTEMLTTKLETLQTSVDPGKIYTHDITWLDLTDDRKTKAFHEKHIVDVIRKLPLGQNTRLRRCPRCASVMEDISVPSQGQPGPMPWVWQSQKTCICYNSWASPAPREVVRPGGVEFAFGEKGLGKVEL